jgi:hypothetical protein
MVEAIRLHKYKHYECYKEPPLEKIKLSINKPATFVFAEIPHWADYFAGLKDHRELVQRLLQDVISPEIISKINQLEGPCIGVHCRMGDFRKLKPNEDFKKVGTVRTPEDYFIEVINELRKKNNRDLPVSVFTDGYKREFKKLLSMKNITFVEGNRDIVDLLLLSKSKVIITSPGSTFSYWAGFLSNAPLIMHPDHIYKSVRPSSVQVPIYEGPFNADNASFDLTFC